MRLRPFVKKASRADQLTRRVPSELIAGIKQLSVPEVRKLFRGFVPLDFVALIQQQNPKVFEEALRGTITQQLSTEQHKKWIQELYEGSSSQEAREEAVGDVYVSMLNNDPKRRGVLSEILLDGSYSDAFQYARRSEPELRLQLRQNLNPLSTNGIVVPFCPIDKALGIEHPLWDVTAVGGKIDVDRGLDKEGHCTYRERVVGTLTEDQRKAVEEGKREMVQEDGNTFLKCSFKTQLPKFQSFLHAKSRQAIMENLNPERQKMGRTIPPAKYKRRDELEQKEKDNELSIAEMSELSQLRKYFQKKQVEYTPPHTRIDAPVGGDEGEGTSRHQMIATESDEDFEASDESRFELKRRLGEDKFDFLAELGRKVPLSGVMVKMRSVVETSLKDPARPQLEKEVFIEAMKTAQKYYGEDSETSNTCNTCKEQLGNTSPTCPYADQMKATVFAAYAASQDIEEFRQALKSLDSNAASHYEATSLESIMNNAFSGIEIGEDDLGDLDLSGFESFEDDTAASPKVEKYDTKELKEKIENSLSDQQKAAFYGTNVSSNTNVTEEEADKALKLGKHLNNIMQEVFNQELEDELATYLVGYGAT